MSVAVKKYSAPKEEVAHKKDVAPDFWTLEIRGDNGTIGCACQSFVMLFCSCY